ncbi:heavy-metal-associated domain-containing protein [Seonamhaeicola sediminis]|uniref:Heavy-metal-associated domain-containing protein n=1 Tax=Seonamhaeicola sediminis TaxID=2528206 RepID=A0A562YDA5_9FLAO|nr:heavy metal-associated domain-containing protein [Seonamhaeicola sediminis]TWO32115.1 heavy-metal-associated domain-containing protein [Seonamhaeicola sediminis]
MNTLKNTLVLVILVLFAFSCKNKVEAEVKTVEVSSEAKKTIDPNATFAKAEFTIDGMTCEIGCAKTIEKKIANMEGVKSAKVDFDKKLAMVEYNEAKVTPTSLEETVTNVADVYKVSDMKTVDIFSTTKKCSADCKEACCSNKTEADKKTCATDCKKACCIQKA